MKLTDGKKTVDIRIMRWNSDSDRYDPDWSADYFDAGSLPFDEALDAYIVNDVDDCVDMANSDDEDGACAMYDGKGNVVRDPDMMVFVEEVTK